MWGISGILKETTYPFVSIAHCCIAIPLVWPQQCCNSAGNRWDCTPKRFWQVCCARGTDCRRRPLGKTSFYLSSPWLERTHPPEVSSVLQPHGLTEPRESILGKQGITLQKPKRGCRSGYLLPVSPGRCFVPCSCRATWTRASLGCRAHSYVMRVFMPSLLGVFCFFLSFFFLGGVGRFYRRTKRKPNICRVPGFIPSRDLGFTFVKSKAEHEKWDLSQNQHPTYPMWKGGLVRKPGGFFPVPERKGSVGCVKCVLKFGRAQSVRSKSQMKHALRGNQGKSSCKALILKPCTSWAIYWFRRGMPSWIHDPKACLFHPEFRWKDGPVWNVDPRSEPWLILRDGGVPVKCEGLDNFGREDHGNKTAL